MILLHYQDHLGPRVYHIMRNATTDNRKMPANNKKAKFKSFSFKLISFTKTMQTN